MLCAGAEVGLGTLLEPLEQETGKTVFDGEAGGSGDSVGVLLVEEPSDTRLGASMDQSNCGERLEGDKVVEAVEGATT